MLLEIKCGPSVFTIEIDPHKDRDDCERVDSSINSATNKKATTVGELRKLIAEKAHLNSDLKLIWKGKFIGTKADEPLSIYPFSHMDKIVALGGKKTEDPGFASLIYFEKKNVMPYISSFDKLAIDLAELERNFLEGKILDEMLNKMEKKLKSFGEMGTKHIEAMDSLQIYDDATEEEQKKRNREKRKQLIESIDNLLNKNDKHILRLSDYKFSVEHPNQCR